MTTLFTAVRTLLVLAHRLDRRRLHTAALLLLVGLLATPAMALLLREFTDSALDGAVATTAWLAVGVAVALVLELSMGHFAHLFYFELGEQQETALHQQVLAVSNGTRGLEHLDSAEFADTLTLVREDVSRTRASLEAVLQICGLALQAVITTVILATVNPWLALLPLAAVPPVLVADRAQAVLDRAKERSAESTRLSRHLLALATSGHSVPEARLAGAEGELMRLQAAAWQRSTDLLRRAALRAAALRAGGQLLFALAYGGGLWLVIRQALDGAAGAGDIILVIALAVQVSVQVASGLGLLAMLQGAGRTFERLDRLRAMAAEEPGPASRPAPDRLEQGIRLENVSFRYPGSDRDVLADVSLTLPAGATVALVGENGAGKSTLVKLLCGMYRPTSGRILVDGTDLNDLDPAQWSARIAPLFQDFARLELPLRENVGVGRLSALHDDPALREAIAEARAERVLDRVPDGLDGLLGKGYGDGAELSGGQWQLLGLARCLLREDPLLMLLDEPASALDAAAEHELFQRFTDAADRARSDSGSLTLFISHRFSTVRSADLIVVLENGTVHEHGSHDQLLARRGLYAELFELQARAYR
ncbi:ABC transporter ATP-binding protein [Streptomyces sp. C11-1]|uniref:ABC transporter ATP-binding protein n=1 Tax=Streptomyces durocortorensis TaxID=2811104 RepID=A0ABY9W3V3_9ACTN|nr:ABC transporter ATP-binding protein [Streptomyces durocortorensis]WNF30708.1 ABC transporter ATP-binding protein [Streptomyces durocortorensis]